MKKSQRTVWRRTRAAHSQTPLPNDRRHSEKGRVLHARKGSRNSGHPSCVIIILHGKIAEVCSIRNSGNNPNSQWEHDKAAHEVLPLADDPNSSTVVWGKYAARISVSSSHTAACSIFSSFKEVPLWISFTSTLIWSSTCNLKRWCLSHGNNTTQNSTSTPYAHWAARHMTVTIGTHPFGHDKYEHKKVAYQRRSHMLEQAGSYVGAHFFFFFCNFGFVMELEFTLLRQMSPPPAGL